MGKKWARLSCWNFQKNKIKLKEKKNFCEKYLQKEKLLLVTESDGMLWKKAAAKPALLSKATQTQTHVVAAAEDGFNQLHTKTRTHTRSSV